MTKKRKFLIALLSVVLVYGAWCKFYSFDKEAAAEHVTEHALSRSHTCCAWYVMRAMQAGGCPAVILPAWAYRYAMPLYGFREIPKDEFQPEKGDIVVFPSVGKHIWGHIAMWNGHQWVSDFKQRNLICATAYSKTHWRYYRHK